MRNGEHRILTYQGLLPPNIESVTQKKNVFQVQNGLGKTQKNQKP